MKGRTDDGEECVCVECSRNKQITLSKPGHEQVKIVLCSELDKLRVCYEDVFTDNCGLEGGSVIGGLMMRAFRDPFYLRYRFVPRDLQKGLPLVQRMCVVTFWRGFSFSQSVINNQPTI